MIGLPRHVANEPLADVPLAEVLPAVERRDLAAVAANVSRHGGDPRRFAVSMAAALAADAVVRDDADLLRAVIAVSAWRAGALALRDDALARLEVLSNGAGTQAVAAAALGLDPDIVPEFVSRQGTDRFWWPGRARFTGYVCAVGGFAGLGGVWVEPPSDGHAVLAPGGVPPNGTPVPLVDTSGPAVFAVRSGDTWWRIDADVWGSRLSRAEGGVTGLRQTTGRVSVVTRPDTYLAWIHVRDES